MAKYTRKDEFLKHLAESQGIVSYACEKVGISRFTAYNWKKQFKNFSDKWDEITEKTIDIVESKLLSKIRNEDTTAIIFYLKTKGKSRGYVEQVEQNITVNPFLELMKSTSLEEPEEQ